MDIHLLDYCTTIGKLMKVRLNVTSQQSRECKNRLTLPNKAFLNLRTAHDYPSLSRIVEYLMMDSSTVVAIFLAMQSKRVIFSRFYSTEMFIKYFISFTRKRKHQIDLREIGENDLNK